MKYNKFSKIINSSRTTIKTLFGLRLFALVALAMNLLFSVHAMAQDGNAGIAEATNKVKGYFDTGCDLMYAIGAVVGIIGAIKVLCAMN